MTNKQKREMRRVKRVTFTLLLFIVVVLHAFTVIAQDTATNQNADDVELWKCVDDRHRSTYTYRIVEEEGEKKAVINPDIYERDLICYDLNNIEHIKLVTQNGAKKVGVNWFYVDKPAGWWEESPNPDDHFAYRGTLYGFFCTETECKQFYEEPNSCQNDQDCKTKHSVFPEKYGTRCNINNIPYKCVDLEEFKKKNIIVCGDGICGVKESKHSCPKDCKSCVEDDQGLDFQNKGTTNTEIDGELTDYCEDEKTLIELYCKDSANERIFLEEHTCEGKCVDGACVEAEEVQQEKKEEEGKEKETSIPSPSSHPTQEEAQSTQDTQQQNKKSATQSEEGYSKEGEENGCDGCTYKQSCFPVGTIIKEDGLTHVCEGNGQIVIRESKSTFLQFLNWIVSIF